MYDIVIIFSSVLHIEKFLVQSPISETIRKFIAQCSIRDEIINLIIHNKKYKMIKRLIYDYEKLVCIFILLLSQSKTFHFLYLKTARKSPWTVCWREMISIFSSNFLLSISFSKTFLLLISRNIRREFLYTRLNVSLSKSKNVWLRSVSLSSSTWTI